MSRITQVSQSRCADKPEASSFTGRKDMTSNTYGSFSPPTLLLSSPSCPSPVQMPLHHSGLKNIEDASSADPGLISSKLLHPMLLMFQDIRSASQHSGPRTQIACTKACISIPGVQIRDSALRCRHSYVLRFCWFMHILSW